MQPLSSNIHLRKNSIDANSTCHGNAATFRRIGNIVVDIKTTEIMIKTYHGFGSENNIRLAETGTAVSISREEIGRFDAELLIC